MHHRHGNACCERPAEAHSGNSNKTSPACMSSSVGGIQARRIRKWIASIGNWFALVGLLRAHGLEGGEGGCGYGCGSGRCAGGRGRRQPIGRRPLAVDSACQRLPPARHHQRVCAPLTVLPSSLVSSFRRCPDLRPQLWLALVCALSSRVLAPFPPHSVAVSEICCFMIIVWLAG